MQPEPRLECCLINIGRNGKEKNLPNNLNTTLTDFRNNDKIISLEGVMLVKVDWTSMLSYLESRAPFLNKKLWNFTAQLPESYSYDRMEQEVLAKGGF